MKGPEVVEKLYFGSSGFLVYFFRLLVASVVLFTHSFYLLHLVHVPV
jgi:hypothetical protein